MINEVLQVSVAFVYNLLFVIARQVFVDLIGPTGVPVCMQTTSLYANTTKECTDDQLMNMQVRINDV